VLKHANEIKFLSQIKASIKHYNNILWYLIFYVTYFVTSLTMPDMKSSDMMSALQLASARLSKLCILFKQNLLDDNLCNKIPFISKFFL